MKKRVYITGIAGLIGSNLAKFFLKKGWEVTGCDNLIGGYAINVPAAATFHNIDINNFDELKKAIGACAYDPRRQTFSQPGYDVVIHCAALAYEGLSVFSPSLITTNIYSGTASVAAAAIFGKCKLFINCSSMARYGDIKPPFQEYDEPHPIDPYGYAKLHAEQQLELLSKIYPEFKYYTVVPHNVSGAQQVYTDPYRNVLSIMIHQALAERPIFIYGDGEQKRSFSHVDDCVKAIYKIIEIQPEEKIFNIGPDDNEISINDLAATVASLVNPNVKIHHIDPRPQEVKYAWCSSELAQSVLGYEPNKNLTDIITDIKDFIQLNGVQGFNYNLDIQIDNNKKIPLTWDKNIRLFNNRNYPLNRNYYGFSYSEILANQYPDAFTTN